MNPESFTRRRLLQGGLAGSLFLPMPWAWVWAQSEGAMKLLRAPKAALVIGNSAYRSVPSLRNPGNDSTAMAEVLRATGFEVTLLQDADRVRMLEAIAGYAKALAAKKSVGLFYFAGHGFQLDWRNYLVPVDATVEKVQDVAAQCVDVASLLDGIRRAANPMNVIVLDACRDNPFEGQVRSDQKGLSQMDAPTRTLLAYATSPGNGADDGTGANGLYTESLLREMKVREAKIEDVFKRVRLGVRKASRGRQIPWESTSLEEDFYFVPPEQLRKLSEAEEQREFQEELALFEKAKSAREPAPLEQYLRAYPSGRFAELAQLRLDQVLAAQGEKPVEIAPSQGNPFTAGTKRADTNFRVGDRWTFERVDRTLFGKKPVRFTTEVTAITDRHVIMNGGESTLDLLGNQVRSRNMTEGGREMTPRQDQPLEFVVGKRWSTRFTISKEGIVLGHIDMDYRVAARETISVPAGTFDCFRVEGRGISRLPGRPSVDLNNERWFAPERVRLPVAAEEHRQRVVKGHVDIRKSIRTELVSFVQA